MKAIYHEGREESEIILPDGSYIKLKKISAQHVPTTEYEHGDYEER